jgi:hypothetical protein
VSTAVGWAFAYLAKGKVQLLTAGQYVKNALLGSKTPGKSSRRPFSAWHAEISALDRQGQRA